MNKTFFLIKDKVGRRGREGAAEAEGECTAAGRQKVQTLYTELSNFFSLDLFECIWTQKGRSCTAKRRSAAEKAKHEHLSEIVVSEKDHNLPLSE